MRMSENLAEFRSIKFNLKAYRKDGRMKTSSSFFELLSALFSHTKLTRHSCFRDSLNSR